MKLHLDYRDFVPKASITALSEMTAGHHVIIKVSAARQSKWGDFRAPYGVYKLPRISVNRNLSKEAFLMTLVHEWAHYELWKEKYRGAAHGNTWKQRFISLMQPFLTLDNFPEPILNLMFDYFQNPKAAISSAPELHAALTGKKDNHSILSELNEGTRFVYRKNTYERRALRRTRILCLRLDNQKQYLFMANTPVQAFD